MRDIDEVVAEWQEATGLANDGGDPSGVTPEHLATLIREDENEIRYLKAQNKILADVFDDALRKIALLQVPVRTLPEF